jgi:hypothetical protein
MTIASHLLYYEGYKEDPIELQGADYQQNAHTQQTFTQTYKNTSARHLNSGKFFDYKVYSLHFKNVTDLGKFSKTLGASFIPICYTAQLFYLYYRVKNILFRKFPKMLARLSETTYVISSNYLVTSLGMVQRRTKSSSFCVVPTDWPHH